MYVVGIFLITVNTVIVLEYNKYRVFLIAFIKSKNFQIACYILHDTNKYKSFKINPQTLQP